MSAHAHHTITSDQQHLPTLKTKIVDSAKPVNGNDRKPFFVAGIPQREIVGGVSVPPDAPAWVKDSLEHKGRLAKESAERKAKRLAPARKPWTPERKLAAGIARAARKHAELQEASAAVDAWSLRPKSKWREREKWSAEDHRAFNARVAEFAATHQEPTPRQKELVEEDYERSVEGMPGIAEKPSYEPGTEPWVRAKNYRVLRAKFGFKTGPGRAAGGNSKYTIPDRFEESYLRSTLSYVLQRFVSASPKGGRKRRLLDGTFMQPLMGGPAKDVRQEYWAKLECLDQPYLTLCSIMRSGWRIELDRDFAGFAELRAYIERKVRNGKLACLPHVVVGHVDAATGALKHPHLWFWLPEDCKVLYDRANPKASRKVMDLYDGVVNGCFSELEDIGADAGGLGNCIDGKNPLSPEWSAQVWNDTDFPSLHQWSKSVNIFLQRDHLVREQCIRSSDLPVTLSNGVFSDARQMAWLLLHAAYKSGDKSFRLLIEDRRLLATWLLERLRPAFALTAEPRKTDKTLRNVARYVAAKWAPGRLERRSNRGMAFPWVRHYELRGDDGRLADVAVRMRQSAGAKVGNAGKKQRTIDAMVTAMEELWELGCAFTPQAVADRVDVSRRTVNRNWKLALAAYNAGEIPDIGSLIGGGDELRRDHETTPALTEPAQPIREETNPYVVHLWPGGYDAPRITSRQAVERTLPLGMEFDPCCPSTDAARYGSAAAHPTEAGSSPATSSPDTAGERPAVPEAGDGESLQRSVSQEAGRHRSAGSSAAGGGGAAGDDRAGDVADPRRREGNPTKRGGHPEVERADILTSPVNHDQPSYANYGIRCWIAEVADKSNDGPPRGLCPDRHSSSRECRAT